MKRRGFTLIEVLIVIIIIGILIGAMVPRVGSAKGTANDTVRMTYAQGVVSAIIQYRFDHSDYPEIDSSTKIGNCNCATLDDALGDSLAAYGYPMNTLPKDPIADSSFQFCGEDVTGGQFVYCKISDGVLFVSHLENNKGNANSSDFDGTNIIDENTERTEIRAKLTTDGGDLYIYLGGGN